MAQPVSTPEDLIAPPSRKAASAIVAGSVVLGTMVLLGALVLWAHYGTTVFFEMIASGIASCF